MICQINGRFKPDFFKKKSSLRYVISRRNNEISCLSRVVILGVHTETLFTDGNGRTSRLLMNLELMKSGFPAAILPVTMGLEYYKSLDLSHTKNDYQPFINLIIKIVEESFKPYWHALGVK